MSRIYYTSDVHSGHSRVSEIRGFEKTEEHDQHIIDEWNRVVKKNDIVYVLGDIAVGKHKYALDILKNLPGRKHLISGNHDIVHPYHSRGQNKKEQEQWLSTFETIQPFLLRKSGGQKFLMSHFPYPQAGDGSDRPGSRYDQFRLPDMGLPLLHGHTHGKEQQHDSEYSADWTKIKNQFHVGWDAWGTLVSEDTILEWLNETYIYVSAEDYSRLMEEMEE